jgi:hypothetical protein
MIPFTNIKTIFSALSTHLGKTIIRADQVGAAPAYPYGSYKITTDNVESAHQNIIEINEGIDPTNANIKTYGKTRLNVSITFYDKNKTDVANTLANNALQWLKSIAGRELCKANFIIVQLIKNNIQDRTALLDTFYENQWGFDVMMDYTDSVTETIEAIEIIKLTPYPENVAGTTITINEP